MTKPLKFDKEHLALMLKAKEKSISRLEDDLHAAKGDMLDCFVGNPPEHLYSVIVEPIVANLKDEEAAKTFAKMLVLAKRITNQVEVLKRELFVVQSLLDEQSPLMMAATNFDELEVLDDQSRTS
jgi:hypothetical protein